MSSKRESYMRWALALALEGLGRTSPNPMVGAVIVKGGKIVGEGYHKKAGTPHAEVNALEDAGSKARGADMYVTLEPCVHHGETPPCVDAIATAGIKRVFIGTRDVNPLVNGKGIRALQDKGIDVSVGILEESCVKLNDRYNRFMISGVPHVTAKTALSLDGKIAVATGESKWITNKECRNYVHRIRGTVDAVMVGGGTVRKDDPRLNVRLKNWHGLMPVAVVVDSALNIPRSARLFRRPKQSCIFATTAKAPASRVRWIEKNGFTVMRCRATGSGRVFLPHMLQKLGELGITSILLEGGGELFSDFIKRKLVDHMVVCMAPVFIGGGGKDFLPGIAIPSIDEVVKLSGVSMQRFGDNFVIEGSVVRGGGGVHRNN
ncbi:MAG TPA: bifunctional diaminohydroxyphosphoribosylaminopyrimidine deaminase/5-amino-6-(5-phosphoribosylamino)uracil reductase RibD [bacterium]|nr:bifunctional diaminohydroxyphosphoribosylaminopyrimidine deaminase/5-amino-6-(5-phosphoribosylamino)uracil reductase RibD [bacterium]